MTKWLLLACFTLSLSALADESAEIVRTTGTMIRRLEIRSTFNRTEKSDKLPASGCDFLTILKPASHSKVLTY